MDSRESPSEPEWTKTRKDNVAHYDERMQRLQKILIHFSIHVLELHLTHTHTHPIRVRGFHQHLIYIALSIGTRNNKPPISKRHSVSNWLKKLTFCFHLRWFLQHNTSPRLTIFPFHNVPISQWRVWQRGQVQTWRAGKIWGGWVGEGADIPFGSEPKNYMQNRHEWMSSSGREWVSTFGGAKKLA